MKEPLLPFRMTAKADGVEFSAFVEQGWSMDQLLEHGYIEKTDEGESTEPPISRCRLAFECHQTWASLEPLLKSEAVRYCHECQSAVHLVRTEEEFNIHAQAGHCVAVAVNVPISLALVGDAMPEE